ncbi:RT0821/Lpp0805 family surface protein [Roseateles sp.]|uniref:RT0821/Lpp0805 family surface protein n=1 Tax=Roseateles sp. TaxID=1971397 RepID=UPI00286BAFBB|nr:RT0821/Lpp0805 family surface protein [Roseateles sp.]
MATLTASAGVIIKALLLLLSLTAVFMAPAHANSNLRAMNSSAFSRFSAADQALMRVQVDQAIAAETEGQSFEWKNDKSRASGVVTALARNQFKGLECRNLRIQNSWGNQRDDGVFRFCQQPGGQWGLTGPVQD